MTITPDTISGPSAADLRDELHMLTRSGRINGYWRRPADELFQRLGLWGETTLSTWAAIDWYGPLELWRGPEHEVSEIIFNGPSDDPFFVIQRGAMLNTDVSVHPSWITWTQRQLLLRSGKLDLQGDGRWPDSLVQGVVDRRMRYAISQEPASRNGGSITIRILPERWRSLDDLVQGGTISRDAATLLLAALEAGTTVLVSGATGSGKTTLTAGFTQELGKRHRMVFVEDGGELPRTMNSLHLEADSSVVGEFTRFIKFTLRVKPTYTVVGEVRGGEAMALLQAAATGHPGVGTIHATNVQGALRNLERMAMLGLAAEAGGGGQAAAAIARGLITSDAVNLIVVQIGTTPQGRRSVLAVEEVLRAGAQGQGGDNFPTNPLFQYDPYSDRLVQVSNVNATWGLGRF